ncbi:PQQ-binding-like beta-propeller repeat protein [Candidatus Latescibacterota bacterium]
MKANNNMKLSIKSILIIFIIPLIFLGCSEKKEPLSTIDTIRDAYWPTFRGDRNLSGTTDVRLPDEMGLRWSYNTDQSIVSSPVIGFGNVYIGSTDGKVYSIDLLSGQKVWETDTGDDIEASPLLIGQTLYIGNLSGGFFAIDALSGAVRWETEISGDIMGSANSADVPDSSEKLVFVGSYDTNMYCFNAETGDLKWTYETGDFINGAPATDGNNVVFGGCDAKLHIISAVDGTKTGEVLVGSYIAGSTALVDNRAYLGHYDSKLVCIDLAELKIVWEYMDEESRGEFFSSPAIGIDRVIIGSRDHSLHCADIKTGRQLWKFRALDEIDSSPVIASDKVVFGSSDGRLYILDIENGNEIWSYEIGASITGCPAVTGGMIVIGAEDGRVYAFGENK